jgi:hypothetical protein
LREGVALRETFIEKGFAPQRLVYGGTMPLMVDVICAQFVAMLQKYQVT